MCSPAPILRVTLVKFVRRDNAHRVYAWHIPPLFFTDWAFASAAGTMGGPSAAAANAPTEHPARAAKEEKLRERNRATAAVQSPRRPPFAGTFPAV
jgi:hypothetical protein